MSGSVQLGFDSQIFDGDFSSHVPESPAPIKSFSLGRRGRATKHDPFGLLALRAERQIGRRESFTIADFAKAAVVVAGYPDDKAIKSFVYCVITAYAVALRYFLTPEELFSSSRDDQEFGGARHLCRYMAVTFSDFSSVQVGRVFGRHHATVGHSVQLVSNLRMVTPSLEAELDNLEGVVLDLWALAGSGEGFADRLAVLV